jgi:hypothetical protein
VTTYTTFVNYGNTPLWKQITLIYPDVPEANARQWAEHCERFKDTGEVAFNSKAWKAVKYVYEERKKLLNKD